MVMTSYHDNSYADASPDRRIVVGVDSSDASIAALRWAVDQAHLTGSRVEAVLVYQPDPYMNFAYGDYPAISSVSPNQLREDALDQLRGAVAAVSPGGDTNVQLVLLAGSSPAKTLTRHAGGAAMLVVGGTHHHGLGVLLGSTAAGCVRHAPCPVVVVPAGETPTHSGGVILEERQPAMA